MLRNLRFRHIAPAVIGGLMAAAPAAQADTELALSGYATRDGAGVQGRYGDAGLFLGPNFNYPGYDTGPYDNKNNYREYFNWRWVNLTMTIFDGVGDGSVAAGDAQIAGAMTRIIDEIDGVTRSWQVEINLSGLKYRDDDGNLSNGVYDSSAIETLAADPENGDGYGYEWMNLSMTVTPPPGYSTSAPSDWSGLPMPNIGHDNPAELHYDAARGLTFEAWYDADTWSKWYKVGDTKADVVIIPDTTIIVPVPAAAVMGLIGLSPLPLIWLRRKDRV